MTGIEVAGEVTITIETTADRVGCHSCGVIASLHDRRRVLVRDLEIAGRPTVLIWNKRIWRCREAQCSTCTWTERHDAIAPRASLTQRVGAEMCRRVGPDGDSVATVGRDFGVGWACVMNVVEVHGRRLVNDADRIGEVSQLGLDETAFQRPSKHRGHTSYVIDFVDLTRPRLLDVVADRTGAAVDSWPSAQPAGWLANISEGTAMRRDCDVLSLALPTTREAAESRVEAAALRARRARPGARETRAIITGKNAAVGVAVPANCDAVPLELANT